MKFEALVNLERTKEPAWSSKVDRWYQLDEVSYAFCEALEQWQNSEKLGPPDLVILALEGASNLSDFDFVKSGGQSPAKFVYTLPNICISVIFQSLQHQGKVYCFHKGPETLKFALQEAQLLAKNHKSVWVLSSSPVLVDQTRRVTLDIF